MNAVQPRLHPKEMSGSYNERTYRPWLANAARRIHFFCRPRDGIVTASYLG
jgi:hypothetical protein